MSVKLTIHSVGRDECVLSEKEAEGMIVTFDDGTVNESFLSTRSLVQLLRMKLGAGNNDKVPNNDSVTQSAVAAESAVTPLDDVDLQS